MHLGTDKPSTGFLSWIWPWQAYTEAVTTNAATAGLLQARSDETSHLSSCVAMWRSLAAGASRAGEARNVALADERAALSRHHRGLKAALQAFRTDETAHLRTLSLATCDQSPLVGLCFGKVFRACSHGIPSGHDRENNSRLLEHVSSNRQSFHTMHAWADPGQ